MSRLTDKLKSDAAECAKGDAACPEDCAYGPMPGCDGTAELVAAYAAEHEAAMESARSLWQGTSDSHAKAHEAHRNAVADSERIIREREAG